ncbi:MAG: carboxypeptidase regulatory-like domain-containing protein [bacterium]
MNAILRLFSRITLVVALGIMLVTAGSVPVCAETEPNNTIATANVVQVNTTVQGSLSVGPPPDVRDCYQCTLPSDGLFQVGIVPVADLNVGVQLWDTDGQTRLISKNDGGKGVTEGFVYVNLRAGTYTIEVYLAEGAGTYDITFNFAPVVEVDPEPNNSPLQALQLNASGEATGHIGYYGGLYTDIYDYYKVTTPDDGKLEVTVYPDQDLNLALGLYDSSGYYYNTVWQDASAKGQSEKFVSNNLAAGTYYVGVVRTEGYGSYSLTSIFTKVSAPNDVEPNIAPSQAIPITLTPNGANPDLSEGSAQGRLGFEGNQYRDDRDYYYVYPSVYGKLTLTCTAAAGSNLNPAYSIFDAQYRTIVQSSSSETLTLEGLPMGLYYIGLYREDGYGAYTLSCASERQQQPAPFSLATTDLPVNSTVSGIPVDQTTPNQYFRIDLPADGKLVIRSTYTNTMSVSSWLYYQDGTTQIANYNNWYSDQERVITVNDLRTGTYILRTQADRDGGLVTHTTEFTPVTKLDSEPNDMWEMLAPIATLSDPIQDFSISGHIGYGGNGWRDLADAFLLDVKEDGAITVKCTGSDTMNYHIGLYEVRNGTYNRLDYKEPWYTAAEQVIGKPNIAAGQYVVYVYRFRDYGSYDIKIDFTPNRSVDLESDNNWYQGVPITIGQPVVGHVGYQKPFFTDLDDWYTVELPADGSLGIFCQGDSTMNYGIYLYNSDLTWRIDYREPWYSNAVQNIGNIRLKAGLYRILVRRHRDYGTYNFYTVFNEQPMKDSEPNNIITMARPMNVGDIVQGAFGYGDNYSVDFADWYSVQVSADGRYKLSFQTDPTGNFDCYLYASDMFTKIRNINSWWYRSDLWEWEGDLAAGTYYILCYRDRDYGSYTLRFGDTAGTSVGSVAGKVTASNGFALYQVTASITNRSGQTDFAGDYRFDSLAPGTYAVTFSSGAKYYPVTQSVQIVAGQTATLNATMLDANRTAPAEPKYFRGVPNDKYVHLFWSASESPDVADGGGYKLYIDNDPAIDLGNVLLYKRHGLENGHAYSFRLTVYDKYGNESVGTTLYLTATGEGPVGTPTVVPTQPPVSTPTPIVTPVPTGQTPLPTSTPVATPTYGVPTPTPDISQPTPTPTEGVPPEFMPERVVFDCNSADQFTAYPGGFIGMLPGNAEVTALPEDPTGDFTDGTGVVISTDPGAIELLLFSPVEVGENLVMITATVRASAPGAAVALAALDASMDGSIATNIPANSQIFMDGYQRMVLIFDPPGTSVIPILQVANLPGTGPVEVYLDNIEVFITPKELIEIVRFLLIAGGQ